MSHNPYKVETPGCISFSGGRTSGYMLRKILDAYDNKLPDDLPVVFSNTGKEMPETLDFVQECSERWDVPVHWIECDLEREHKYRVVTYETAARNGEPYAQLIDSKPFLPNPVTRYCTSYLKIKPMKAFLMQEFNFEHWNSYIGLRYDEPRRVARLDRANAKERWETEAPLNEARATVQDVFDFWKNNDFDLRLINNGGKTPYGNCDLCFLKSTKTIQNMIKLKPELANWWIEQESKKDSGDNMVHIFRKDRANYQTLLDNTKNQGELFEDDEPSQDTCFCHD
jgi:3'-phosphoadenosine 5'-phosphosulfate sulfotransferase (PAPS reductase)/FAD synthetase